MKNKTGIGGLLALTIWVFVAASSGTQVAPQPEQVVLSSVAPVDSLKKDPETGLIVDEQLTLVKGQCTACHSSKLILQSHFSKEKWIERIHWMQRTQKLWDLGESEPAIVAYLVKHYGPVDGSFDGRRPPMTNVKWYRLSR